MASAYVGGGASGFALFSAAASAPGAGAAGAFDEPAAACALGGAILAARLGCLFVKAFVEPVCWPGNCP